jgi:hypothetical protein
MMLRKNEHPTLQAEVQQILTAWPPCLEVFNSRSTTSAELSAQAF